MRISLISFIILFSYSSWACSVKAGKKIYSLSGPVTLFLKDLDLLHHSSVLGVSIFHPVDSSYKGELLPGGIFLGTQALDKFNGANVFFDDSQELSRILATRKLLTAKPIKTRGLLPLEVTRHVMDQLSPLLSNCADKFKAVLFLQQKSLDKLKLLAKNKKLLFFLGAISTRTPELLMVNDGVVKWLVQEKIIETYPSELAYVNWSAKVMNSLSSDFSKIGMIDSGREKIKKVERTSGAINLTFPGLLVPGSGQVNGLIYLFESI